MRVRPYHPRDYDQVIALYKDGATFGGQFDPDRDSETRLKKRIEADPDAIFVLEMDNVVIGTVSLLEDGRTAWLFRFAVKAGEDEARAAEMLCDAAVSALKKKGHRQVIVYAPAGDERFAARYETLGFTKGGDYTCYWKELEG